MNRNLMRSLVTGLPVLGLSILATDSTAEGVDSFRWPVTGSNAVNFGFDHDRADVTIRDKDCGTKTYDQHTGIDIYAPSTDLAIYAAAAGVVISSIDEYGSGTLGSTDGRGFGNSVVLYHGDGLASLYGHMLQDGGIPVVGQWIECGEEIGTQGGSGNVDGDHLHFEVRTGVTLSRDDLGGFVGQKTYVDPFMGSMDDDDGWCGESTSMWVEHTDDLPSRTCATDKYIGRPCHSATVGVEVDDGTCVQQSPTQNSCEWMRCVDGAWLALPDTAATVCTSTNHPHSSCDAIDCTNVGSEAACDAWTGSCKWSCAEEACVAASELELEDDGCNSMPPTCDDGEQNGDETGIDCGGPSCAGCQGDPCSAPEDCITAFCTPAGICGLPFDCHEFDGDPTSCGSATGCVYHACASSCSPNTETACAAGCLDQCGALGCVTGTLSYYSSNDCISGPANGIAQIYRYVDGEPVLAGMVGIDLDGRFCADLEVGESYYLQQGDLPGFDCFDDYYVNCSAFMTVGPTGVDGVCADVTSCEDLGELLFDCGS